MKAADIACVVLASGLSERFGTTDKLVAKLCGRSVLDHVLDTVTSVGFGKIFVVSQGLSQTGFTSAINGNPENGQGHALRLGLAAARAEGWDSICVVLGDMPLVKRSHIHTLMKELGGGDSVVSILEGQTMPPAIFRGSAITSILAESSASGARTIFHQLKPETVLITAEQALDVDTPADLTRVACIMKARTR